MSYTGNKVNEIESDGLKITLTSISTQGSDLLNTIMEEWGKFESKLKQSEDYKPSIYQFAYWLVRYSELIQPKS